MSIEDKILRLLFEPVNKYKGLPVSLVGIPNLGIYKKRSIYNKVYELNSKGFISKKDNKIYITSKGKKHILESDHAGLAVFEYKVKKSTSKNLIVMYDIPEGKKKEREWFRKHLHKLGFIMIQRSVWVGPSPLPTEFTDYIKYLKLEKNLKVLRLAKPYKDNSFTLK